MGRRFGFSNNMVRLRVVKNITVAGIKLGLVIGVLNLNRAEMAVNSKVDCIRLPVYFTGFTNLLKGSKTSQ